MRPLILGIALSALVTPVWADPARVVSLGGAVTEIVVALGAEGDLVGRDTTSEYPASVTTLPDVGYVRALNAEGVMALRPGLILAEASAGPPEAVEVLKAAGIPYVALPDAHTPDGVMEKITLVGQTLGREAAATALNDTFAARMKAVEAQTAQVTTKKRVLFVLSMQGGRVMAGGEGSSADAIIQLAGGENAATGFKGYKQMTDEAILAAAPDVILMMDREGDLAVNNAAVLAHPALATTPAGRARSLIRMNGMLLLGFGPRTPDAVEGLYRNLYPKEG